MTQIILSPEEIEQLTGYRQPHAQLQELKRQGFYRARRNPVGAVVLERAHYTAVCAGQDAAPIVDSPSLRLPKLRAVTA